MAGPATAGDLDKYVPADAQFFAHVNVPKLFASDMVRNRLLAKIEADLELFHVGRTVASVNVAAAAQED